jgi:organic radical activating enzyme
MNIPKKFCKAPFHGLSIDSYSNLSPCCEYKHDSIEKKYNLSYFDLWQSKLDTIRKEMIQGNTPTGCKSCIEKENIDGIHSNRMHMNHVITESAENIIKNYADKNKKLKPRDIEIKLGNLCNLKCFMCGPYASSRIMEEYDMHQNGYKELGIIHSGRKIKNWWDDSSKQKKLLELVKDGDVEKIHFSGGEPLMNTTIYKIIDVCHPNVKISFSTNMTMISEKFINATARFNKKVAVYASIDGIGAHNNYIRFGSDWKNIEKNFITLMNTAHIEIGISYILQHTSVFTLIDLLEFSNLHNIPITLGTVYEKSVDGSGHLTINSVSPTDYKNFCMKIKKYEKVLGYSTISQWLEKYKFNIILHKKFVNYMKFLDKIRHTDFLQTFHPSWEIHENS